MTAAAPAALDPVVSYDIDIDAEPGNVLPALARLLIGIDRLPEIGLAEQQTSDQGPTAETGVEKLTETENQLAS